MPFDQEPMEKQPLKLVGSYRPVESDAMEFPMTDGDEALPAEFAELAAQLVDDAVFLADCYPANASGNHETVMPGLAPGRAPWSVRHRAAIVAAGVMLAVGLGIMGNRLGDRPSVVHRSAQAKLIVASPIVVGPSLTERRAVEISSSESLSQSGPPLPVLSFQELSGPEQEAVIDLFEAKALEQESLSI